MEELSKKLRSLGLNKKQSQAYLYILKHKRVNLKILADLFDISTAGASKLLKDMVDKGFLKSFEVGNKKVFMATDLDEIKNRFLEQQKDKIKEYEQIFSELEAGYGGYTIRIFRMSAENLVKKIKKLILQTKEVSEFVDYRNIVSPTATVPAEYKDIKFNVAYYHDKPEFKHQLGRKIQLDLDKSYAHLISFDDKVQFITSNKETVLIENQEIANSIQFLIKAISWKKEG